MAENMSDLEEKDSQQEKCGQDGCEQVSHLLLYSSRNPAADTLISEKKCR